MSQKPPWSSVNARARTPGASLEFEIAQERAAVLGRLGRRLDSAIGALRACDALPQTEHRRAHRQALVADAADALWMLVVQRETLGLSDVGSVLREYQVPAEVAARMGQTASS